jgi:hypothetical protein
LQQQYEKWEMTTYETSNATPVSAPPPAPERKNSLMKGIALLVLGALVALSGVTAANALGLNPFQSRRIDRSQPTLLKSIQDVSRFQAAVGNFEKVIDIEDDIAGVPAIIAGRRTLFVAAGTVNAYVDLSGLADKDLETRPHTWGP